LIDATLDRMTAWIVAEWPMVPEWPFMVCYLYCT